jgi:hypothetical protein
MADPETSGGELDVSFKDWEIVQVTLANGVGVGPDIKCKQCQLYQNGTVTSQAQVKRGSASTYSWPVSSDPLLPNVMPVPNLNQLYFTGTTGDTIKIMYGT